MLFSDAHGWLDLVSLILQQILQPCLKEKACRSWQNGIFWNVWRLCLWLLEGTVAIEISKFGNSTQLMTWIYYWDCHGMEDCFLLIIQSVLFENLEPDSLFHTIVWFLFSFPVSNGFSECSGSFWHQQRCFMKLVLVRWVVVSICMIRYFFLVSGSIIGGNLAFLMKIRPFWLLCFQLKKHMVLVPSNCVVSFML